MSWFDLRWAWRHPVGWLRVMWLPVLLAGLFAVKASAVGAAVFDVIPGAPLWPLMMAWVSGVLIVASVAPLEPHVQAITAGSLFAISVLRASTYLVVWISDSTLGGNGNLVVALLVHWIVMAAIAVHLPVLLQHSGQHMTAEAGANDRGAT